MKKWDIYDIIKIVKLLEVSGLLIDCATETVKHEIKKQNSLIAPSVASWYNLWFIHW